MSFIFTFIFYSIIILLVLAGYRTFQNKFYILLIGFLLLGNSYLNLDEKIFGYINLGLHSFKIIPGLTLYSKDLILLLGFAYLVAKKEKIPTRMLVFSDIPKLFIIILSINFFIKLIFLLDQFDFNSIKSVMRTFSPILSYYVILYLVKEEQVKKIYNLLFFVALFTLIPFCLSIMGILNVIESSKELSLTFGSLAVSRYQIPHTFVMFIPFFMSIGILLTKAESKRDLVFSISLIILTLLSFILSTYRTILLIVLIGLVIAVLLQFLNRKKRYVSVLILGSSLLTLLILSLLGDVLKYDVKQISLLRFTSVFEELFSSSGTGGVRMEIVGVMLSQFQGWVLFLGKVFTTSWGKDIFGANSDIGLMSTLMQGGVFILIPIFLTYKQVYKLLRLHFEDNTLEVVRIATVVFMLSILPSMLFNFDFWFQMFLSQTLFFFMGLFDAVYYNKIVKPKLEITTSK
jgi:hypothetical protein